jgi:hypothetical protein
MQTSALFTHQPKLEQSSAPAKNVVSRQQGRRVLKKRLIAWEFSCSAASPTGNLRMSYGVFVASQNFW